MAYTSFVFTAERTLAVCNIEIVTFNIRQFYPFGPSRWIKASFYIPENRPNFPTTNGFQIKISMKLVEQYMVIFFNF